MDKARVPQSFISKMIDNGGDAVGAVLVLGVWGEVIPAVLGVLGIAWFCLRFVNFIRTNVFNKEPWGMR